MTTSVKYIYSPNEAASWGPPVPAQRTQFQSSQPAVSSPLPASNSPLIGSPSPSIQPPLDQSIEQQLRKFMSERRSQGQFPSPVMGRPKKLSKSMPWIIQPPGGWGSPAIATSSTYYTTDGSEPRVVTRTKVRPVAHRNTSTKPNPNSPGETPVVRVVGTRSVVEGGWKPDLASHQRNHFRTGRRNSIDPQHLEPQRNPSSMPLERSRSHIDMREQRKLSKSVSPPPTPPAKDNMWTNGLLSRDPGGRPETMLHIDSPLLPPPPSSWKMQRSVSVQSPRNRNTKIIPPPLTPTGIAGKTGFPIGNQGGNEEKDVVEKKSKTVPKKDKKFPGKSTSETLATKITRITSKKDPAPCSSSMSGVSSVAESITNKIFQRKQESKSPKNLGQSDSRFSALLPFFDFSRGNATVKNTASPRQPRSATPIQDSPYPTQVTPSLVSNTSFTAELEGSFPESTNSPPKFLSTVFEGDSAIDVKTPFPFSEENAEAKISTVATIESSEASRNGVGKATKDYQAEAAVKKRVSKESSTDKFWKQPPLRKTIYENMPLPAVPESKYSPSVVPPPLFPKTPDESPETNRRLSNFDANTRRLSLTIPPVGRDVASRSPVKDIPSRLRTRESFVTPDSPYGKDIIEWVEKLYKDPENMSGSPIFPKTPKVTLASPGTDGSIDAALRESILHPEGAVRGIPTEELPGRTSKSESSFSARRLSVFPRSSASSSELARTSYASSVGDNFQYDFFGVELGAIEEEFNLAPVGRDLESMNFSEGYLRVESGKTDGGNFAIGENVFVGSDNDESDDEVADIDLGVIDAESDFDYSDTLCSRASVAAKAAALESEIEAMLASKRNTPRNSQTSAAEGSPNFFLDSDYDDDDALSTGGLLDSEIEAILESDRGIDRKSHQRPNSAQEKRLTALEELVLRAEFMELEKNEAKKSRRGTMYIAGRNSQVEGDIIFCLKSDFL